MNVLLSGLLILALILSPLLAFVAGFHAGALRNLIARVAIGSTVVVTPMTLTAWPLFVSSGSQQARGAAGMALVMLGIPLAFWTFFALLGVIVGWSRRSRPG